MQLGVNRDISKYKMTIKGSITLRSLLVTAILAVVTGFIFFGLYDYLEINAQLILIMLIDAPIAAFYMEQIPLYNLPAEKIIRLMLLYIMAPKTSINESVDEFKEQSKGSKMIRRLAKYKYNVPRSIQQFIPLEQFYENGMARTGNRYSMCYLFSDVDSKTLSDDDKISLFKKYEEILSLFSDVTTSYRITVVNRNIPSEYVYDQMRVPDFPVNKELSDSINEILDKNIQHKNQQYSDLMITITTFQQSEDDARMYFDNLQSDLESKFFEIGSTIKRLSLNDRISLYHFLNHPGSEERCNFTDKTDLRSADIRDYCCPSRWKIHPDYIEMGSSLYRVMYLQNVNNATFEDDFWRSLTTTIPRLSISTIEFQTMDINQAKQLVNRNVANSANKLSAYRTAKTRSGDISSYAPPALLEEVETCTSIYQDLNSRKQNIHMCTVLVTISAEDKEELKVNTQKLAKAASGQGCNFEILYHQQVPGLFSCLPYGISNPIEIRRAFTTESVAAFVPFSAQMIQSFGPKAIWEGNNPINRKVNSVDRSNLDNGNGLIFGDSGSGKSVQAKLEIIQRRIKEYGTCDIIILDPKGEYSILAKTHGGTTVNISVDSKDYINIMDVSASYGAYEDGATSPIKKKIAFLQNFIAMMVGDDIVPRPFLNSIIDRCCDSLYKNYARNKYQGEAPTLKDLYRELQNQKNNKEYAEQIALAIETYAFGSLSVFAEQTNIPEDNGFIVYNTKALDDSFKMYGLMVMLDQVLNRVSRNYAAGRYTYIYIDEFHKFFGTPAEPLIMDLWKMGRALHCFSTGITQNITDVLNYQNGVLIVHNSEYLKILKLKKMEILEDLERVLDIPPQLVRYITGDNNPTEKQKKSSGLIKYANTIVPFESEIPHETYLYQIINSD